MADLQNLKNELLDELIKITDETGVDPIDRFDIVMGRYMNTGETDLLAQATSIAKTIEDPKDRGNAMMQLLDEIDLAQSDDAGRQNEISNSASKAEVSEEQVSNNNSTPDK